MLSLLLIAFERHFQYLKRPSASVLAALIAASLLSFGFLHFVTQLQFAA